MPSVAELTTAVQGLVEAWNNEKNEILSKIAELESAIQSSEIPASLLEQITTLTSDIRSTVEVPVDVPVVEEPATDELPPNTTEGANQVLGDQPTDDDAGF